MDKIVEIVNTADILGELPFWCDREQAFYWLDCRVPALRRLDYATRAVISWTLPKIAGSFALREKGGALIALIDELVFLDFQSGKTERIASVAMPRPDIRFNDGKCDSRGRFWIGTKGDSGKPPEGVLYRFDPDGSLTIMDTKIRASNSLAWSPDDRTMYFADTGASAIYVYPFNAETGTLGKRSVLVKNAEAPDGAAIDSEGYLWSAVYGGYAMKRYAPDGRIDRVIEMPVRRPTSCAFAGPDLDWLYITTARQRLTDAELAAQPLAGALLGIQPGVRGLPMSRFAG